MNVDVNMNALSDYTHEIDPDIEIEVSQEAVDEFTRILNEYSKSLPPANTEAILESDRNSAGISVFPGRENFSKP